MKFAALIMITMLSGSAFAYNCAQYAQRAIHQQAAANQLLCGFSGPRWATSYSGHLSWCSAVSIGIAANEDLARQSGLENCLQSASFVSNCNAYAFRAVRENKAGMALGCGFSGPRWQNNAGAHKLFCMITGAGPANSEDQARRNDLEACVLN